MSEAFAFDRVDEARDPQALVDYLDDVGGALRRFKQLADTALGARPGQKLLDVGCGTGDDARRLALVAGRTGRVVGIDKSETMVAEARRRADEAGLPVDYRVGDAHRLPFADARFDATRAERVLQHLADPERALAELARVTRPGGRIVIGPDPDWEALVVDCAEPGLMRRIKAAHADHLASGGVAHRVPGMLRALGLEDVSVTPGTLVVTELSVAERLLQLAVVAHHARQTGAISEHERARWLRDLRDRDRAGRFFLALTGLLVTARRR